MKVTEYNKSKEFKETCLAAIIQIKQFCTNNDIPFYMTFATGSSGKETEYVTSKNLPPECGITLRDDKFRKIILAEHGFDLVINHVDSFDIPDICDQAPNSENDENEIF